MPASSLTWFQAMMACASSGKRLLTSAEWQQAAMGTQDDLGQCNTNGASARNTGGGLCVSAAGVEDMVGNVEEWVADWIQANSRNDGGDTAPNEYGSDMILGIDEAAPESFRFPAALIRGGSWRDGTGAGVYALDARNSPARTRAWIGFRCTK